MTTETTSKRAAASVDELDRMVLHQELVDAGYDLPELADTMEEADARAVASTYLFVLRNIKRDIDANDAEFTVLQDFNRARQVQRQHGLIAQMEYLSGAIKALFGFMTVTGKKKSLNLIGGRVGMRAQTDELVVEDEEAVIAWARQHKIAGIINTRFTVDRKGLRIYVAAQQQLDEDARTISPPPGVKLEQRDDQFYATPVD